MLPIGSGKDYKMNEKTKIELEKKLAKMPEMAKEYIVWQLGRIGELGETTAQEIIDGTIKPESIWAKVTEWAKKQLSGRSGAIAGPDVFKQVCEILHIDGVIAESDVVQFCYEAYMNGKNLPSGAISMPTESAPAPETDEFDFDNLFD